METLRCYRAMKAGQLDIDKGRALVWVLMGARTMLEAMHLQRIEDKLSQLQTAAESRGMVINGHAITDRSARLPN